MTGIFRPGTIHANCDNLIAGGGGGGPATTWNPADILTTTLSNGNLSATGSASGGGVRATNPRSAGKLVFEIGIGATGNWGGLTGYGLSNAAVPFGTVSGSTVGACICEAAIWINGSNTGQSNGAFNLHSLASMLAVDLGAHLFWLTASNNPGVWSNGGNPGAGTGGLSLAALNAALYPVCTFNSATDPVFTLNVLGSFVNAVPSGFSAWG